MKTMPQYHTRIAILLFCIMFPCVSSAQSFGKKYDPAAIEKQMALFEKFGTSMSNAVAHGEVLREALDRINDIGLPASMTDRYVAAARKTLFSPYHAETYEDVFMRRVIAITLGLSEQSCSNNVLAVMCEYIRRMRGEIIPGYRWKMVATNGYDYKQDFLDNRQNSRQSELRLCDQIATSSVSWRLWLGLNEGFMSEKDVERLCRIAGFSDEDLQCLKSPVYIDLRERRYGSGKLDIIYD